MLVIQSGENKGIQVGVQHSEAQQRFKSLLDLFQLYPTEIHIFNKTKGCRVEYHIVDNKALITITNPEDEVFKL